MRKLIQPLLLATLLVGFGAVNPAFAKGEGGPVALGLVFRPVEAVVLAHAAAGNQPAIIVDKCYLGSDKAGDHLPVDAAIFQKQILVKLPAWMTLLRQPQPELFVVLIRDSSAKEPEPDVIGKGLSIQPFLSRRISWGRVYLWFSFSKWTPFTSDPSHAGMVALDADVARGLSLRDRWTHAQAASDPAIKLALLRPFLVVGGETGFSPYEVWSCSMMALEEVEKAGPAAIPFLTGLLSLPGYQDNFAPEGWRGFGAQERAVVKMSLALAKSRSAANPGEKLSQLRPLFDMPDYDTVAGFDPAGLLGEYMNRGLAAAEAAGPGAAIPFLRGLLQLPQFQESYSPSLRKGFGHDQRAKIELALARLGAQNPGAVGGLL